MFKILINFLVSLILFPRNLIILFINLKKILKSKKIVIQTEGGFGHSLTIQICSRYVFKKDFLYISFIEKNRHNEFLPFYLNINHIIFKNNLTIKFYKKNFTIGEKEHSNFKLFETIIIKLISSLKNSKIFYNKDIYKYLEQKYIFLKNKNVPDLYRWEQVLIYLFRKKRLTIDNKRLKEIIKRNNLSDFLKFEKSKNKNISIYLRKRLNKDLFSFMRNGSNKKDYIPTFDYLIKKKFNLFIFGDKVFDAKDLKNFKGIIIDCNNYTEEDNKILQLFFLSISDTFISEAGGAQYFGPSFKKFMLINSYPPKLQFSNCIELQKRIFDKKNNKYLSSNQKSKMFWWKKTNINNRFILKNNTDSEIKSFIKKIIF